MKANTLFASLPLFYLQHAINLDLAVTLVQWIFCESITRLD